MRIREIEYEVDRLLDGMLGSKNWTYLYASTKWREFIDYNMSDGCTAGISVGSSGWLWRGSREFIVEQHKNGTLKDFVTRVIVEAKLAGDL